MEEMGIHKRVREQLIELSEIEYAQFSAKLLPGTENIIGVRLPILRKAAKKLVKESEWRNYLEEFNKQYAVSQDTVLFEEVMLAGMVIGQIKIKKEKEPVKGQTVAFEELFYMIESFIPKINNWSVCDSFCAGLKVTKQYKDEMWDFIVSYFETNREYELRFAIVMMLDYYIEETYIDKVINYMAHIHHEAYYVKMAVAWCLSMCYVKFPEKTLDYLKSEENHLDDFTYNKTIQKIIESLKVSKEEKEILRTMKHFVNS